MKTNIYLIVLCLFCAHSYTYSQVGINTSSPRGVLHIDPAKNTPDTGTPTAAQVADDFIVTADGRVGLGTVSPSSAARMDIQGSVKINNGNLIENNSRLITDANGVGMWMQVKNNIKLGVLGAGINIPLTAANYQKRFHTGGVITIPPGKSLIQGVFYNAVPGLQLVNGGLVQIRFEWSDSSTAVVATNFKYLNDGGWGYVTIMTGSPSNEMSGSGYWLVENMLSTSLQLYLCALIDFNTSDADGVQLSGVASQFWPENGIIIMPIDN